MIVEMRTSLVKAMLHKKAEERFAQALPERQKLSPLGGFFHTDVGTLNQIVELWHLQEGELSQPLVRGLVARAEQVADLLEREPDPLCCVDDRQPAKHVLAVAPLAARRARTRRWPARTRCDRSLPMTGRATSASCGM